MVNSKVVGDRLKAITDNPVMVEEETFRLARQPSHEGAQFRVERMG